MGNKLNPVIKWSGSKRPISNKIISYFPSEIKTYYEPFLGGGSIMGAVLKSGSIKVNKIIASDLNEDLINTWKLIQKNPEVLINSYKSMWEKLHSLNSVKEKEEYYNLIRSRFNRTRTPSDFFFIMRTCFNGMPRYNSKKEFNSPYHLNRDGISPEKIEKIIREWSCLIEKVEFKCCDYSFIQPEKEDYIFLDPPYQNTKQMYFGNFDNQKMIEWLKNIECHYSMTYDGTRGDKNLIYDIPEYLYTNHILLENGNSSFDRLNNNQVKIKESLYIK